MAKKLLDPLRLLQTKEFSYIFLSRCRLSEARSRKNLSFPTWMSCHIFFFFLKMRILFKFFSRSFFFFLFQPGFRPKTGSWTQELQINFYSLTFRGHSDTLDPY